MSGAEHQAPRRLIDIEHQVPRRLINIGRQVSRHLTDIYDRVSRRLINVEGQVPRRLIDIGRQAPRCLIDIEHQVPRRFIDFTGQFDAAASPRGVMLAGSGPMLCNSCRQATHSIRCLTDQNTSQRPHHLNHVVRHLATVAFETKWHGAWRHLKCT